MLVCLLVSTLNQFKPNVWQKQVFVGTTPTLVYVLCARECFSWSAMLTFKHCHGLRCCLLRHRSPRWKQRILILLRHWFLWLILTAITWESRGWRYLLNVIFNVDMWTISNSVWAKNDVFTLGLLTWKYYRQCQCRYFLLKLSTIPIFSQKLLVILLPITFCCCILVVSMTSFIDISWWLKMMKASHLA